MLKVDSILRLIKLKHNINNTTMAKSLMLNNKTFINYVNNDDTEVLMNLDLFLITSICRFHVQICAYACLLNETHCDFCHIKILGLIQLF